MDREISHCPFGVISVLFFFVKYLIEGDSPKLSAARSYFSLLDAMSSGMHPHLLDRADWLVTDARISSLRRVLLGRLRPRSEPSRKPLVFVYDKETPEVRELSQGASFCAKGQWGMEVHIHEWLLASHHLTNDPDEADFFFVPAYSICMFEGGFFPMDVLDEKYTQMVRSLPYFKRNRGRDHIFTFGSGLSANVFRSWRREIPNSIQLSPETWLFNDAANVLDPPFDTWRDIAIPGYLHRHEVISLAQQARPLAKREHLAVFLGRIDPSRGSHPGAGGTDVRGAIRRLQEKGKVFVAQNLSMPEMHAVMGNSRFCFVPKGKSAWSLRFYESLFANCVPVVLSDFWELPFESFLDLPSFVIKWPMDKVGDRLMEYLEALSDEVLETKVASDVAHMYETSTQMIYSRTKRQTSGSLGGEGKEQREKHVWCTMSEADSELDHAAMDEDVGMNPDMDFKDVADEDSDAPVVLPQGVKKEIIQQAPESEWRRPKKGDEVTVHYVGTLESDGSQFDSSRDRGPPFVFTLGKGEVIKGWDLGVATMQKGELAKFTLAPEFAYGDAGSPPKIPEKATLVFEVELLSLASKEDLFGDEGVIKTGVDYTLGSGSFGPLSKAVDKALRGMKMGEQVSLQCTKDYMGPDGGCVEITMHELYEVKDVSFCKDRSIMKKQIKQGEGHETPKDTNKVKLSVDAATDGEQPVSGFTAKTLEFNVGSGEVCDALECAVLEMKKGERAILTCMQPERCVEPQLGLSSAPSCQKIVLSLELVDFEKGKDTWDISAEEKVEFGMARKDVGSALFKQGRTELALDRYKKVADLLSHTESFKDDTKAKAQELKKVCELNKAACHLKLKQYQDAKKACDKVLENERDNVKALFRRAQADFGDSEFMGSTRGLKRVLELDPQNREARVLLKQAQAGQKGEDQQVKNLFAKMCKGLSSPSVGLAGKAPDVDAAMETEAEAQEAEGNVADRAAAAAEAPASAVGPTLKEENAFQGLTRILGAKARASRTMNRFFGPGIIQEAFSDEEPLEPEAEI
ncbi:unnamed protein product [Polarella glacialis]|uniref:peptidylprolyl isomerase n=1 Tax=Polarella glacialis TaxID=89957 RepID=A0A813EP42_POLGL|nr:unnamed protein product [Polarella glacialis]